MSRFALSLRWIEHAGNGIGNLRPARALGFQLLYASGGQPIDSDALLVFRHFPIRGDPFLTLQPVQRWIERTGVDLQDVSRICADRLADPVAVLRPPPQGFEDEQIERSLQQLDAVPVAWTHLHPRL